MILSAEKSIREAAARAARDLAVLSTAAIAKAPPPAELSPAALGAFFKKPAFPLAYSKRASEVTMDVYDALCVVDSPHEDSQKVVLLYTGYVVSRGERDKEYLQGWNREHVWPQSRAGMDTGTPGIATDLHNLFAADSSVNSSRSNKALGEISKRNTKQVVDNSPLDGGDGVVHGAVYTSEMWQPTPRARGRIARALLYMACVYGGDEGLRLVEGYGDPEKNEMGDLASVLKWHREYPPTAEEKARNRAVAGMQGNSNPFVDAPYLADAVRW